MENTCGDYCASRGAVVLVAALAAADAHGDDLIIRAAFRKVGMPPCCDKKGSHYFSLKYRYLMS